MINGVTTDFRTIPKSHAAALAAGLLSLALLTGCSGGTGDPGTTTSPAASETATAPASESASETFTYEGEDGKTVLELLLENDPEAEVSGEGEMAFVTGIDGRAVDADANEFWALYVDGEFAQEGAGTLETEDGQEIEWKLDTFE
ncbi:uncharacterized protein DUF4430 [Zhihengliuella halotolerans]|uniref:Uncharacterized protein DUF4430 n=1 Tax=Zhihengliuella halotolerans TaxID=370736 RepID=A0A4Q8AG75_9MICC|nr:uncharacterized protein DUF4430 [Zhihengliuella halotolerans]